MVTRPYNIPVADGGSTVEPIDEREKQKPRKQGLPDLLPEPETTEKTGGTPAVKTPTFEELFSEMLTRYTPETVTFEPMDAEEIRSMLIEWLRPAYEQAIARRKEQTARYNAELDADAWARGMGTSTYVTDVKDRAFTHEARDVSDLEGEYAASLASRLYDAMQSQQEQKLETDRFNAEQINDARARAASAALSLYQTYKSGGHSAGSGSKSTAATEKKTADTGKTAAAAEAAPTISLSEATNLVARLSPENRAALYKGTGTYAQVYQEILKSIGSAAFRKLMSEYPA